MLTVTNSCVMNFENAIRGARNPMNSWEKGDSHTDADGSFVFGENDLALAVKLCRAGSDHRKFMRQIIVCADICGPLYWWKEYDTYKIGTVANSTSTMHKIHAKQFDISDFSTDRMNAAAKEQMNSVISTLESLRLSFLETKDKEYWYSMVQLLPASYNQLRTCTLNYETMINIYHSRSAHKLDEWHVLCDWISTLPYAEELIIGKAE